MDTAPQIAGKALNISCDVKTAARNGVILAHGSNQAVYSLHLADGKLISSVREEGKLFTATAPNAPTGKFKVQALLAQNGAMTLMVNGKTVATGKAPSSILKQPVDGLDIGRDLDDIGRDLDDIGRDLDDIGRDLDDIGRDLDGTSAITEGQTRWMEKLKT